MTEFIGKAGKKLFARHIERYAPEDPLYEFYTDERGKQKRRKRQLPPGLSSRDSAILRSVKIRAHYLDKGFSLCGIRFGWTFLIGLVPIAGDVTDAFLNYTLVVKKAQKADLPEWLITRMLINNAISAGVGLVPIVGDVLLAVYKANSRNAALLDEFLRIRGSEFLRMQEAEENGKNSGEEGAAPTASDIKQIKPGSGMTPDERGKIVDDYLKDTGDPLAPSTSGAASTVDNSKSDLFGMRKKGQSGVASKFSRKGRFVENLNTEEDSVS